MKDFTAFQGGNIPSELLVGLKK